MIAYSDIQRELLIVQYMEMISPRRARKQNSTGTAELEKVYGLKESARLGPGARDDNESVVLSRIARWTTEGLEYEADPRQAEQLVRDLGMGGRERRHSWSQSDVRTYRR